MDDRRDRIIAYAFLVIFVLTHVPYLLTPITGSHRLRQADTAAVARNFAVESPNILYPRVDRRGETSGITGMEFPLYQYVASIIHRITGSLHDGWGKLLSLVSALGVFLLLGSLLCRFFGIERRYSFAALFFVPAFFLFAGKYMPSTTGLLFGVGGMYATLQYHDDPKARHLVIAAMCLACAALIRPFLIFFCLPLLVIFIYSLAFQRRFRFGVLLTGVSIIIPFVAWYYLWAPHLVRSYGLNIFFFGYSLSQTLAEMASVGLWIEFFKTVFQYYTGYALIPVAIAGIVGFRRGLRANSPDQDETAHRPLPGYLAHTVVWIIPLATALTLFVIIGRHFSPHYYYFFAFIPSAAILIAYGLRNAHELMRNYYYALLVVLGAIFFITIGYTYRVDDDVRSLVRLQPLVAEKTAPLDRVVIINTGTPPLYLHLVRRHGWTLFENELADPKTIRELTERGARWVITRENDTFALYSIDEWLARISRKTAK
ncbi:MAG TPA: glycosyltransferase family 39 protein [Spirochaetota bacterium]|nr:glycosyltransferase family 39 protein [Spirochaetota bacterium]HNT10775.1 glycosyltransferase family 39 protein [Spirochaetota bacterium]